MSPALSKTKIQRLWAVTPAFSSRPGTRIRLLWPLALKHGPYLFDDLARSRIPKAIGVHDLSIVDINAELTYSTPYEFHLRRCFFP
jgi:hypothetical protein